jgi:hypothetical protein
MKFALYLFSRQIIKVVSINFLLLLFFNNHAYSQQNDAKLFRIVYSQDYENALQFITSYKNKTLIISTLNNNTWTKKMILAAVFPELIRFSYFQNQLEMVVLEKLYVQYGTKYSNFSVGRLQMKPSFAEETENKIRKIQVDSISRKYKKLISYASTEIQPQRKERVERLNDLEWQLLYMMAFSEIMFFEFSDKIKLLTEKQKTLFLAAAYNWGYTSNYENIEKWQTKKIFPKGTAYKGKQFSYAEIALYFYENDAETFFSFPQNKK